MRNVTLMDKIPYFTTAPAAHAAALDRWIGLSVEAFPSDPASRAERIARVEDKTEGFRYFVETYLPHYVRGEASLFHEAAFTRFPQILYGKDGDRKKGAKDCFVAPRGSSKSTHLSLGGALYAIVLGLEARYSEQLIQSQGISLGPLDASVPEGAPAS